MRAGAVVVVVAACGLLAGLDVPFTHADPPIGGTPTVYRTVTETRTVDRRIEGWNVTTWHAHAVANRRALNLSVLRQHRLAHTLARETRASRRRYEPTVRLAIAYARAVYGVDQTRRTHCESTDSPSASNGTHFGLLQFAAGTWASTPFAAFSPYDPVAAELAGGWMIRAGRSGEWSCRL